MNFDYWLRRIAGKATCRLSPGARLLRSARIRNIGGRSELILVGGHTLVAGELLVFPQGGRIVIGEWCYLGENSRIWSSASICIGDRVLISHDVNIIDSLTHPINPRQRHQQFRAIAESGHPARVDLDERPIVIEEDAWIAAGAIVLRGVTIGRGAIVGAGAVVGSDVPPHTVVGGNPAHVIRELGEDER
ncbi:MAG: acyltransferase [Betaproteobacteria bacterium]|nr:acyltransferase [Betaproteobacteria bacterium]